jgi:C-terminal processing protease CtpA/Prc
VLLKGKDVPVEVELASPDKKPPAKKAEDKPVAKPDAKQETKAAPAKDDAAPQNPYDPGDEKANEAPKPEKSSETEGAPSDPYAEVEATEDQTVVATHWGATEEEQAKPEPPKSAETKLAKKDVNAALLDFTQLVGSIDGTWIPQGLKLDKVKAGSIFAKAGLLAGDVVVSVDGQPMQTIDDAADLYARAGNMKQSNVQILRAGKEQTLRVAIQ